MWDGLVAIYEEARRAGGCCGLMHLQRTLHQRWLQAVHSMRCKHATVRTHARRSDPAAHDILSCLLQGLVDAVGVSNYGPKQLQKIGQ